MRQLMDGLVNEEQILLNAAFPYHHETILSDTALEI